MTSKIDTGGGHILVVLAIYISGVALYLGHVEYGKEVMAGALGSLWTLLQLRRGQPADQHN